VVERLEGTPTTDFGAPDIAPSADSLPLDAADLRRFSALLKACWQEFDAAVSAAAGRELRKGPRGGGRELEKIVEHVLGSDAAYLRSLGWKPRTSKDASPSEALAETRQSILEGLEAAAGGQLPERGPRGGALWSPRYFVRRSAWHVLDHAWEIEDRVQGAR
jgi:hypothetical protein